MKSYHCYIKSHCEAPDYDVEFEAKNKKEAVKMILDDIGRYGWEEPEVAERVCELNNQGNPIC